MAETQLADFQNIFSLDGKVVVVTGGSRGLGLHAASGYPVLSSDVKYHVKLMPAASFLQAGASKVYITSRKASACAEAVEALNALPNLRPGARAIAVPADSSQVSEVERLVAEVSKTTDHVDVLFANAGATWGEKFDTHPDSAFAKVMDLNVKSVFNTIRLFAPLLQKRASIADPSRVIVTGSVAGIGVGSLGNSATFGYSASKAAVIHLARNLAVELGPRHILVNSIAPGFFPSKMASGMIAASGGEKAMAAANPGQRLGKPEDIAGTVVFLASRAASHINGATITIDGGNVWKRGAFPATQAVEQQEQKGGRMGLTPANSSLMVEEDKEWGGDFDPFSDPEEKRVLFAALDSFYRYCSVAHYNITHRRRQAFYALPSANWQSLAEPPISYLDSLDAVDSAIDANSRIAMSILSSALSSFNLPSFDNQDGVSTDRSLNWRNFSTPGDMSKVHTIVRQFYRDWSAEGQSERDNSYAPVLDDLTAEFPTQRNSTKVLIPGAGLGRLVFETCRLGFIAEGNEISYHALFASSWVLNHIPDDSVRFALHPWLTSFANQVSRDYQLQQVQIPDVHPGTALNAASDSAENKKQGGVHAFERLSMSAADFTDVYGDEAHRGQYDCVATVFFIDTAPNLLSYLETISNCLKAGGVWINLGPLLWHFQGVDDDDDDDDDDGNQPSEPRARRKALSISLGSVELTNTEVLALVSAHGFTIEKQEIRGGTRSAGYIQQPESMLQSTYRVAHWVARKNSGSRDSA
ncbi:MAG: putative secondary metabolism biosynthetic enzyme [Sclerophora amabilis]|nr:MAG: putative secondary metabolism biosynthetic enzyme [Sclerophora amabilis]